MKLTLAQKKKFCEMHPKNQVIKKEKLAKCYNSILMNPHQVCQSSAINFSKFASFIEDMYETKRDAINDEFFKKCVCSVIIFDELDKLLSRASWYPKGGNKAQIVPYAIAKLMSLIPKDKSLEWRFIWQKQTLYPEIATELLKIAYKAHVYLMEQAGGGIVRTISRTLSVWQGFKEQKYSLSDNFMSTLVSKEDVKVAEQAAHKEHKFNSNVDNAVEIFKLGAAYWMNVYNDLNREKVLSYGDLLFIKGIADRIKKFDLPTDAQIKRLMKVVEKAEDKGYIMPKS